MPPFTVAALFAQLTGDLGTTVFALEELAAKMEEAEQVPNAAPMASRNTIIRRLMQPESRDGLLYEGARITRAQFVHGLLTAKLHGQTDTCCNALLEWLALKVLPDPPAGPNQVPLDKVSCLNHAAAVIGHRPAVDYVVHLCSNGCGAFEKMQTKDYEQHASTTCASARRRASSASTAAFSPASP